MQEKMMVFLTVVLILVFAFAGTVHASQDDVIVTNGTGGVYRLSGSDLSTLSSATYGNNITAIAVQPDDDVVVAYNDGTSDGHTNILDAGSLSSKATGNLGNAIPQLSVQPDGDVVCGTNNMMLYIRSGTDLSPIASAGPYATNVNQIGMQSDGDVAIRLEGGGFRLVSGVDLGSIGLWEDPGNLLGTAMAIQADDDVVVVYSYQTSDGYIVVLGASDFLEKATVYTGTAVNLVSVQPDDDVVAILGSWYGHMRNGETLELMSQEGPFGSAGVTGLAMQSDGDVVVTSADGNVWIREHNHLNWGVAFASGFGNITKLVVQSDDDVVIANDAGNIYLLSGANLSILATVSGFGTVTGLARQNVSPVQTGTVSGQITLSGYSGSLDKLSLSPVKVDLIQGGSAVRTVTVTLTSNPGQYTITSVDPGEYNVAFSACKALRKVEPSPPATVTVTAGGTATVNAALVNGDSDGDTEVTGTDLSVLLTHIGQVGD